MIITIKVVFAIMAVGKIILLYNIGAVGKNIKWRKGEVDGNFGKEK